MSDYAYDKNDCEVFANSFNEEQWESLKKQYSIGDFTMPCCNADAIPKTSPNYIHFFAHNSGQCISSPETVWHKSTKHLIYTFLKELDVDAMEERPERSNSINWQADIFFEFEDRKISIEIQHSYQHLREYLKRQTVYKDSGVECYWILYRDRYKTLAGSLGKHRIKNEFNGNIPKEGIQPCISDLPMVYLELEPIAIVKGAGLFQASLTEWLKSILNNRFIWCEGKWLIC